MTGPDHAAPHWRVVANPDLCQGHARCEDLCPEVFATDAVEGKVVIADPDVPAGLEDKVRLAVRNCPEGALRMVKVRGDGQGEMPA